MAETTKNLATTSAEFGARPRDDELDLFGRKIRITFSWRPFIRSS
jgi:hypothetical protein